MAARIDQAGEERLARFESLRALAALGVLAGHAWGLHHAYGLSGYDTLPERLVYGGGYGVFVFFALSGYLLFRPLARAAFGRASGSTWPATRAIARCASCRSTTSSPASSSCSRAAAAAPASGCASRPSRRTSSRARCSTSTRRCGRW